MEIVRGRFGIVFCKQTVGVVYVSMCDEVWYGKVDYLINLK